MKLSKPEEFSVTDNKTARYARALGHPARVATLQLLNKKQACICGDITEKLSMSQSTIPQRLKELKEAGLIKGDIEGVNCMAEKEWQTAKGYFESLFRSYTHARKLLLSPQSIN